MNVTASCYCMKSVNRDDAPGFSRLGKEHGVLRDLRYAEDLWMLLAPLRTVRMVNNHRH